MKVGRRSQQPTHLSPSGPTEAKIVNMYFGVHVQVANLPLEAVRKHTRTSVLCETGSPWKGSLVKLLRALAESNGNMCFGVFCERNKHAETSHI